MKRWPAWPPEVPRAVSATEPVRISVQPTLEDVITDNTSLILFQLIAFATLPMISAVFALAVMRREVDRDTLQPVFYGQCFATTPVVLLFSIAQTLTRLPETAANIPAGFLFIVATIFYVTVEALWFALEAKRTPLYGVFWAIAAFVLSVLVLSGIALLFSGNGAAI